MTHSVLLDPWVAALPRLGHDLHVRRYGNAIQRIDWVAQFDPDVDSVFFLSSVTVAGGSPGGLGGSGMGAPFDADEDTALVSMADLVQNEVADLGTAWPWGDDGGFMTAQLVDGTAVWTDRNGRSTRIGDLTEKA
ncbi:hypothetical protein ACNHUS_36290 [Actinomycetes bacterium M1A6_2h]